MKFLNTVVTSQLCLCSKKEGTDDQEINEYGCVSIENIFTKTGDCQDRFRKHPVM